MHHFLYQKMQTCLEIEKLIQRNAKTDICRNWRFLLLGTYFTVPFFSTNQRQSDGMAKKKYEKIEQITEKYENF